MNTFKVAVFLAGGEMYLAEGEKEMVQQWSQSLNFHAYQARSLNMQDKPEDEGEVKKMKWIDNN